MDIKQLLQRYDQLKAERNNWDRDYEDIALYSLPGKADFITQRSSGDKNRRKDIYDPTALVANHTLASHMHMALTSPSSPWFGLKFKQDALETDEAMEWLETATERMMSTINNSNFVASVNEHYQDLVAFGTAVLHVGFKNDPVEGFKLVFNAVPLNETLFLEDVHGKADTVFREVKYSARQALQKWPDAKLEKMRELGKSQPDRPITYINVIYPNEKYNPGEIDSRPYTSVWFTKSDPELIEESGYYELPYMIPRWSKMSTERVGYGPGVMALPDVRVLNDAKRLELRSWEKAIDPPVLGMAGGVIGDLHMEAGGFTQVRDTRAITPMADQANWTAVQIKSEELRKNIQSVYLIDQLILPERPNATATEVQIRYEMMQKVLGPTMGRLQAELLNPLVKRVMNIMYRNNQFAEMPQELSQVQGQDILHIEYTGPLSKAQTAGDAVAIERFMQFVMGTAQVDPTVVDVIDPQGMARLVADRYGVPARALRGEQEVAKIQQERQQAQQQAQQAQNSQLQAAESEADVNTMANVEAMRSAQGMA